MKLVRLSLIKLFLLTSFSSLFAEETSIYKWQKERLLNPSSDVMQAEQKKQQVFIYEGMTLSDVEKAMDEHFSRMENMMFVGTWLPPTAAGKPPQQEDDCDY